MRGTITRRADRLSFGYGCWLATACAEPLVSTVSGTFSNYRQRFLTTGEPTEADQPVEYKVPGVSLLGKQIEPSPAFLTFFNYLPRCSHNSPPHSHID